MKKHNIDAKMSNRAKAKRDRDIVAKCKANNDIFKVKIGTAIFGCSSKKKRDDLILTYKLQVKERDGERVLKNLKIEICTQ